MLNIIYIVLLLLFYLVESFQYNNLDEVFIYNHMALWSLRIRSLVKSSMVLTRADHLFIQYYTYYFKTYFNGPGGIRTRLLMCLTH